MAKPDLTFTNDGVFVTFYAETKAGEDAWRVMAEQMGGVARIMAPQFASVKAQLKAAGYVIRKATKPAQSIDDILDELDA